MRRPARMRPSASARRICADFLGAVSANLPTQAYWWYFEEAGEESGQIRREPQERRDGRQGAGAPASWGAGSIRAGRLNPLPRLRLWLVAAVLTLGLCGPGCTPHMARFAASAIMITAAAVTVMAIHDAHYHSHHCGHEYVIVEDRPVYQYQGSWEYYDQDTGRWYRYRELPPGYEYEVY